MTLRFTISTKPNLIGKSVDMSGVWDTVEMTPSELAQWSFFEHRGYCHGVFDAEKFLADNQGYKTSKANAFFKFAEVVTVDIDSKDLNDEELKRSNLEWFLSQPFIREHCFLITPSSGNSPQKPNWHLSFKLDERITNTAEYRRIALALHTLIGLPTDHQTAKASQPTMGTLFKDEQRHKAGYRWHDIYVNDNATPVKVADLRAIKPEKGSRLDQVIEAQRARQLAEDYQNTESASRRLSKHLAQATSDRERVVLEALGYVLDNWPQEADYDLWRQMWMAAYHGSPTPTVRDFILNHPRIYWSDGDAGRRKFFHTWETHTHDEGGTTVASLFYLARRAGWLTRTGYEIPENLAEKIESKFIPEWLAEQEQVPTRLLLQSQTGSGKTQALIHLYRRLGEPKTVVFVPTVKLAADLATTLRKAGIPATLYRNIKTGRVVSINRMKEAKVLVTTLQTFASKIHKGEEIMAEYGLVYVEESDQLIAQFSRGGGGMWSSHVRDREARAGFTVLHDALQHSGVVWLVDATMSQVSYEAANAMSSKPVRYVLNTWVKRKPTVHMLSNRGEGLQKILEGLEAGQRVVAACDTKEQAKEVVDVMREVGALEGKKALVITRDTEHLPEVQAFMADVNEEAPKYDLVAYNSVMASGVSITSVKPDVLVQFCTYLPPRNNLQILNRYRKQARVYCFYTPGENFYKLNADEVHAQAASRADMESKLLNVPFVEREKLTKLRERVAAISIGDEQMQSRSPKEFYKALLEADGRYVIDADADVPSWKLETVLKALKGKKAEQREYISRHWKDAPIVDEENPAPPDMDELTVLCGIRHGQINKMLGGRMGNDVAKELTDEQAVEIDKLCREFRGSEFFLSAFAYQERAISKAELFLADRGKAIISLANTATVNAVLLTVRFLYIKLDDVLTVDLLTTPDERLGGKTRVRAFLDELEKNRDHYDSVVTRGYHKFDAMTARYPDEVERALAFSKVILARIGLKQVYKQGIKRRKDENGKVVRESEAQYMIENIDRAQAFIRLKYPPKNGEAEVNLGDIWLTPPQVQRIERNRTMREHFAAMSEEQKNRVLFLYTNEQYTNFEDAVNAVLEGEVPY